MSTFKKCKVVMLPTNKKAENCLVERFNRLSYQKGYFTKEYLDYNQAKSYHLYFLSDEAIKGGDWMYNHDIEPSILQCIGKGSLRGWRKIIATTDKSLVPFVEKTPVSENKEFNQKFRKNADSLYELQKTLAAKLGLAQPSQSFMEKFVEEYNKGNVITEVLVEYKEDGITCGARRSGKDCFGCQGFCDWEYIFTLKVDPKYNTITIRKVKDSWNKEEIMTLLEGAWNGGAFWGSSKPNSHYFDKWIEENL